MSKKTKSKSSRKDPRSDYLKSREDVVALWIVKGSASGKRYVYQEPFRIRTQRDEFLADRLGIMQGFFRGRLRLVALAWRGHRPSKPVVVRRFSSWTDREGALSWGNEFANANRLVRWYDPTAHEGVPQIGGKSAGT